MASFITHGLFWRVGCILGASGVGLGAYGSHGLRPRVENDEYRIGLWNTAVQYQMINTLALLAAANAGRSLVGCGLLTTGILFFSGSLYIRALEPNKYPN
ncbi:hypothetical protein H4R33_007113, partial [Dimargaris cristalligena]